MVNSQASPGIRQQVLGFAAAGGIATAIHWASMAGLVLLGLSPLYATAIGSLCGAVANYLFQRQLAFPNADTHAKTVGRYALSCLLAWITNFILFSFFHQSLSLPVTAAQIVTTTFGALLNFVVYQRLVFHEQT